MYSQIHTHMHEQAHTSHYNTRSRQTWFWDVINLKLVAFVSPPISCLEGIEQESISGQSLMQIFFLLQFDLDSTALGKRFTQPCWNRGM